MLALLCCLALLGTGAPVRAAQLPDPEPDGFLAAVGAADPAATVLRTPEDFLSIQAGGSYVLANDIDFDGFALPELAGLALQNGVLDGQGHVIRNLKLTGEVASLFDLVRNSVVKNLGFEAPAGAVEADGAAFLAHELTGSTVYNCFVRDGTLESTGSGAAMLVYQMEDSLLNGCWASGSLAGRPSLGGLAGLVYGDSTVSGCAAEVDITAQGYGPAGGLAAWCNDGSQSYLQCRADGDVSLTGHDSFYGGRNPGAGGFFGQVDRKAAVLVDGCLATGDVAAVSTGDSGAYAGGFVGFLWGSGTFRSCAATGSVTAEDGGSSNSDTNVMAGGFAARCEAQKDGLLLSGCYAGGSVTALYGGWNRAGGLVGAVTYDSSSEHFSLDGCGADGRVVATEGDWTWDLYAGGLIGLAENRWLDDAPGIVDLTGTCYYVTDPAAGDLSNAQFGGSGQAVQADHVPAGAIAMPGGPSAWAVEEVNAALELGLVPESLRTQYQQPITRAEFCALGTAVLTALGIPAGTGSGQSFTDTSDPYVLTMSAAGIVTGYGDGTFRPDSEIRRQEAAVMLARLARFAGRSQPNGDTLSYLDLNQAASWAQADIQFLSGCLTNGQRVMGGVSDDRFGPMGTYTREQAILSLLRLYQFLYDGLGTVVVDPEPPEETASPFEPDGDVYRYTGLALRPNATYRVEGSLLLEDETLELPAGSTLRVIGDAEIAGTLELADTATLLVDGDMTVSGDGILDMSRGGTVTVAENLLFDPAEDHTRYLTDGVLSAGGDAEFRRNFYASGNHEFHVTGGGTHEINMWAKLLSEDQYFNVFRVVGRGFEVLKIREPFAAAELVADDWSWLTMDYYGTDFQFSGSPMPSESVRGILQAGVMLAIAREGEYTDAQAGGLRYLTVDAEDFTFSYFDPDAEEVRSCTVDVTVTMGVVMEQGSAVTGTVRYLGRTYVFSMAPTLAEQIWKDFRGTITIQAIADLGMELEDECKDMARAVVAEAMPDWRNALEMTEFLEQIQDVLEILNTAPT